MDPLYNNNPNPTAAPGPKPTPGNAMPNIASAPAHDAAGPAPISNQMPNMSQPVPTPVMEEVPTPTMSFDQAFQNSTAPVGDFSVGATEPVVNPAEPPIDPIAEELAKPIRAAAPVPGSIGSAVSMPAAEPAPAPMPAPAPIPEAPAPMPEAPAPMPAPVPMPEAPAPEAPSLPELPDDIEAFLNSDPAGNPAAMGASVPTTETNGISFNTSPVSPYSSEDSFEMTNTKKPFFSKFTGDNKMKYILIAAGAFLALILIVVLILVMFSGKGNSGQQSSDDQNTPSPSYNGPEVSKTLSCKRDFAEEDLVNYSEAKSGSESVEVGFGKEDTVVRYEQTIKLAYSDVASAKSAEAKIKTEREAEIEAYGLEIDPFTSSYGSQDTNLYLVRSALPEDYNIDNFVFYGLDMNSNLDTWQTNYETSGCTCSTK